MERLVNILFESMTRINCNGLIIRVWRHEPSGKQTDDKGLSYRVMQIVNEAQAKEDAIEQILGLPYVNAVELLNSQGDGLIGYRDWP